MSAKWVDQRVFRHGMSIGASDFLIMLFTAMDILFSNRSILEYRRAVEAFEEARLSRLGEKKE